MKSLIIASMVLASAASNSSCVPNDTNPADRRQADATRANQNNADRQVGMPRIVNYSQRKLLKNAYEDMDQTILTWVYTQGIDGRFVCLGQALGYGVSMGTQFTAPEYPQRIVIPQSNNGGYDYVTEMMAQPEPNGLFMPSSGDATIVDLIDPKTGQAHTAMMEPKVVTMPFQLPAQAVSVPCPAEVDPFKVVDVKEQSTHAQRN